MRALVGPPTSLLLAVVQDNSLDFPGIGLWCGLMASLPG